MCELCYPGYVETVISPRFSIISKDNVCSLLGPQGHAGNILYTFRDKPSPDPDPECTKDDVETDAWDDQAFFFDTDFKLKPGDAADLVEDCKKYNWNDSRTSFGLWFFDFVGKLLNNVDTKQEIVKKAIDESKWHWNYRVVVHKDKYPPEMKIKEIEGCGSARWFGIHEIHYQDGDIGASAEPLILSETVEGLMWDLNKMLEATKKEILDEDWLNKRSR